MKYLLLLGGGALLAKLATYGGGVVTEAVFERIAYALALRAAKSEMRRRARDQRRQRRRKKPEPASRETRVIFMLDK